MPSALLPCILLVRAVRQQRVRIGYRGRSRKNTRLDMDAV